MLGTYTKNLDKKKRVIIPAKFREKLGNPFYITRGPDNVLELRDFKTFNAWQTRLLSNNMLNQEARNFARILLGNTYECFFDDMGRVIFPSNLLSLVEITTEIIFIGVGNKVELWSPHHYKQFQKNHSGEKTLEDIAKKLLKNGGNY